MLSGRILIIQIAFIVLGLVGCSRPESNTSSLKVLLPQSGNSGQSLTGSDRLVHVIINATGEGIAVPILMTWDSCHDCDSATAAAQTPASFSLDIPMGNNRLVQVLAVYKNNDTNSMKFYYGDKLQNFSSSAESMIIPISALGGDTAIVSGRIAGRYLTSANAGPTGSLDIVYTPAGKPSLVIERSFIVNGWFQVFGLAGLPLGYRMTNGSFLFGKSIDLLDSSLAASQKVLRAAVPANYREQYDGGVSSWKLEEPSINVYGFFGAGADSSRYVCKPGSLETLTRLAKADSPTGVTKLTYSAGSLPTPAALISTTTPLSSYYVEGGDTASATCSSPIAANIYSTYLKFEADLIDGNGNDRSAGFTVPFEWNSQKSAYSIDSSDPRVISGFVLPGVETEIESFQLFKKVTPDDDFHLDQVDCSAIATGAMGFVPAGSGSLDASTRAYTVTSNITSSEVSAGISAALCAVKAGQLVSQGVFIQKWIFSSGGGGGGPMPSVADGYRISLHWYNIAKDQCHAGSLELTTGGASGYALHTDPVNVTMGTSGVTGYTQQFFAQSDLTCSSPLTSITINAGSDRAEFRYMFTGSGSVSGPMITGDADAFGSMHREAPFSLISVGAAYELKTSYPAMDNLSGSYCSFVDVYRVDPNGVPVPAGGVENVTIASAPANEVGTYSDSNCSTPIAAFNFNIGEFSKRVYMKRITGSAEVTVTFADSALSDPSFDFIINPVAYAHHLKVQLESSLSPTAFFGASDCAPLKFQLYDGMSNPIVGSIPGIIDVSVNSAGGGMYYTTYTNCLANTGGTSFPVVSIGTSFGYSNTHWYRNLGGGAVSIGSDFHFRLEDSTANVAFNTTISNLDPSTPTIPNMWFDLNPYYNQASGNPVSNWIDRISAFQFVDTAFGSQPQLASTVLGGPWKGLEYAGSGGVGDGMMVSTALSTDFTIVTRVRLAATGTPQGILQLYGAQCNGSTNACHLTINADGSVSYMGTASSPGLINDTNYHTFMVTRQGSTLALYVDGTQVFAPNSGNAWHTESYTTIKIGYTTVDGGTTKTWLNGVMGDVIVYTADNTGQAMNLHNYLSSKFP